MTTNHDPGDEHVGPTRDDACPFCGATVTYRNFHRVGVWCGAERHDFSTAFEAVDVRDLPRGEILTLCRDRRCIVAAHRFVDHHRRDPAAKAAERQHHAWLRGIGASA